MQPLGCHELQEGPQSFCTEGDALALRMQMQLLPNRLICLQTKNAMLCPITLVAWYLRIAMYWTH
jgi:hypothetical protein